MPCTIQYPRRNLETLRTGRLGALYMSSFRLSRKDPGESSQLAKIVEVLANRSFKEQRQLYLELSEQIKVSCRSEDYERAALYRDMRDHFCKHAF